MNNRPTESALLSLEPAAHSGHEGSIRFMLHDPQTATRIMLGMHHYQSKGTRDAQWGSIREFRGFSAFSAELLGDTGAVLEVRPVDYLVVQRMLGADIAALLDMARMCEDDDA